MNEGAAPQERLSLQHELIRKALHVSGAAIPVAYFLDVPRTTLVMLLGAASAVALLIDGARLVSARIGATFNHAVGVLLRQRERSSLTGATWSVIACYGAVVLLSRNAAIAALWSLTVGDSAAAVVGRTMNARQQPGTKDDGAKTIAGSIACAAASFVGVWLLADYSPLAALTIATIAAIAERLPGSLNDNVRITAAAGAAAQILA